MSSYREALRRSFWFPSALFMVLGIALGYAVPELDSQVFISLGFLGFSDVETARSILATIATTTVSVAGLTFSVTLVALTLSSQLLTPRVLRTFRGDRLSQFTLAALIGTFVYALLGLGRLTSAQGDRVPELTVLVAMGFSIASFAALVAFIGHIVVSLQPATVIRRIAADGHKAIDNRFPRGLGDAPQDVEAAQRRVRERIDTMPSAPVHSPRAGFLSHIRHDDLMQIASRHDGLVLQRVMLGDFLVTGQTMAEVWADDPDALVEEVQETFRIGDQRTLDQDIGFPVRQLVDVALRGLSPSLNDPTTAENAMDSVADTLVRFCREPPVCPIRVDRDGEPRFVAAAPDLDGLVRLAFEQERGMLDGLPVFADRMILLLGEIDRAARVHGHCRNEIQRQVRLHEKVAQSRPD